jgi:hypothetical protein
MPVVQSWPIKLEQSIMATRYPRVRDATWPHQLGTISFSIGLSLCGLCDECMAFHATIDVMAN